MKTIKLSELSNEKYLLGSTLGNIIFNSLYKSFTNNYDKVFEIQMDGILAVDSVFARDSIVSIIKLYHGERVFFLSGVTSQDIIDNLTYAAEHKKQSIILKTNDKYELIGLPLSSGLRDVFNYVMHRGTARTTNVANHFNISSQNASQKLKALYQKGLLLGNKEVADTGGLEYIYYTIKYRANISGIQKGLLRDRVSLANKLKQMR